MSTEVVTARNVRFNLDWITRPIFGIALAAIAIGALVGGRLYFTAFVAAGAVGAVREWHRMIENRGFAREFWLSAPGILLALALSVLLPNSPAAWIALEATCLAVLVSARARHARDYWHAGGVIYIGVPALFLVGLRSNGLHGAWIIAGFLLIVWATDTGALVAGNLIGGPKLWPRLSPNKTWAGLAGGIVAGIVVEAAFVGLLGGRVLPTLAYAAFVAVIAQGGDLFESAVKRTFSFKNSGGLIPGHGGVLDRVDSTLSAATAVGLAVLGAGLDPLFGAHP